MREVEQTLIPGVGVNRGHEASLDLEVFMQDLGHRRQTVGGAGGVGNDVVLPRVVAVGIDAHDDGDVRVGGRGGDDDLAGAGREVLGGVLALGEQAGALRHDVDPQGLPVDFFGIAHRTDGDGLSADFDGVALGGDVDVHGAVDGVVFQQMRHRLGIG